MHSGAGCNGQRGVGLASQAEGTRADADEVSIPGASKQNLSLLVATADKRMPTRQADRPPCTTAVTASMPNLRPLNPTPQPTRPNYGTIVTIGWARGT